MEKLTTIGLDIAKHVMLSSQGQWRWRDRVPPQVAPRLCRWILQGIAAISDRNRGKRDWTPLGSGSYGAGSRGSPDAGVLRQARREAAEE